MSVYHWGTSHIKTMPKLEDWDCKLHFVIFKERRGAKGLIDHPPVANNLISCVCLSNEASRKENGQSSESLWTAEKGRFLEGGYSFLVLSLCMCVSSSVSFLYHS